MWERDWGIMRRTNFLDIHGFAYPALISVVVMVMCGGGLAGSSASAEGAPCPNEQFRAEQPYGHVLPDCRAYEMVSPLAKDDNGVTYIESRASVSGEAITYYSLGSFADPKSALLEGRYLSRRGADDWSTRNISPPFTDYNAILLKNPAFGELLFTPDLSSGILETPYNSLNGEPPGYTNLYVADTEDGSYKTVTVVTPSTEEYAPFAKAQDDEVPQAEGASTDLTHVVFQQEASLCCGASPGHTHGHVYEWADGKLYLVDVPPKGTTLEHVDSVGSSANGGTPVSYGNPWHAVSSDGLRVFFTGAEGGGLSAGLEGQVYVRENPTSSVEDCAVAGDACTVEVSASQKTNGSGPMGTDPNSSKWPFAYYRDASTDGSRVFFTSKVELTNDANTGVEDDAANLYEYDLETGSLSDLTKENSEGGAVVGLITASEDGSYVYFVANGVLTETANSQGAKAAPGNCKKEESEAVPSQPTCNLYVEHRGTAGWQPPRFIAALAGSAESFRIQLTAEDNTNGDEADWAGNEDKNHDFGPGQHTARVTSDGTHLVFESERELTKYDNMPVEPEDCEETNPVSGVASSSPCHEVYLYDAVTGALVCVSCNPSGAQPVGPSNLGGHEFQEKGSVDETTPFYLQRNLSENGGRVFFQSLDTLVPYDSNGRLDVYEWEQVATAVEAAKGENSCAASSPGFSAVSGGCVVPVSDVAGAFGSHFMDASVNGNDVFIAAADQLVPSDTDSREDVYDVRVGGGFPVVAAPPMCRNADSCKPPTSGQPGVFGAPASATFVGAGNPVPPASSPVVLPKCRKGLVREHDKCVKRKAKRSIKGKAKRSHGRSGAKRSSRRSGLRGRR